MRRLIGFSAIAWIASTGAAQQDGTLAVALREQLNRRGDSLARPIERAALTRLYDPVARPRWLTTSGQATRQAVDAIDILNSVDRYGLPVHAAAVESLRVLAAEAPRSTAAAAIFDVALSQRLIQLLANVGLGRVDPAMAGFDLPDARNDVDLAPLVDAVASAANVAQTIASAEPKYAGYVTLDRALRRYRVLAADTSVHAPAPPRSTIRPGDRYDDMPRLSRFLHALGDLPAGDTATVSNASPENASDSGIYDGALVEGVRSFQRRHGLDADGAIGPATIAAMRTPLAQRVRQIELALERWRWLPSRPPTRFIAVNVPSFRLYVFENDSTAERPELTADVIVGQAGAHQTPLFTATVREVVFRPYWDVPPKIARTELVPMFRRRPGYFTSDGFEIVRPGASEVSERTFAPTPTNLARVSAGELRLRQRPGSANALGVVKFVFPNRYNVFLHDTPTRHLFQRARRDFSHGCIRVARPNELAELLLRDQERWDAAAIDSAMRGERTIHVPLARPIPVFVLYATAVAASDGTVSFYPDLYGHDATLQRLLGFVPSPAPQ